MRSLRSLVIASAFWWALLSYVLWDAAWLADLPTWGTEDRFFFGLGFIMVAAIERILP